jgi:hypothetical protein
VTKGWGCWNRELSKTAFLMFLDLVLKDVGFNPEVRQLFLQSLCFHPETFPLLLANLDFLFQQDSPFNSDIVLGFQVFQ